MLIHIVNIYCYCDRVIEPLPVLRTKGFTSVQHYSEIVSYLSLYPITFFVVCFVQTLCLDNLQAHPDSHPSVSCNVVPSRLFISIMVFINFHYLAVLSTINLTEDIASFESKLVMAKDN